MVDAQTVSIVFAGLSIGIAALYYTLSLRNSQRAQQLTEETRKIQLLMQVYQSQNVDYSVRRKEIVSMEFEGYDDFIKADVLSWSKVMITLAEWNQLGLLLKYGFVDSEMMFEFLHGRGPIFHWTKWEPIIMEYRRRRKWFSFCLGLEYLAKEMEKYRDKQEKILLQQGHL
jgi:hypothetical protein